MIEQRKISGISYKSYIEGGIRIPETVIERDYCLAWFLFGLSQSTLKEKLIFKGGTALRRCYFQHYRYSEDLDFTLKESIPLEQILIEVTQIFIWVQNEVGVKFSHSRQEASTNNTHTIYLKYQGPLPGREKEIKVDITFREILIFEPEDRMIIKTFDEYSDFLDSVKIKVYSLNEVAIEKICALFSLSRNEPRDLYDIHYLIEEGIDILQLVSGIEEKIRFKGNEFSKQQGEFIKKEKRLKLLWDKRLSQQISALPEYDDIFRAVKRTFRQANLIH